MSEQRILVVEDDAGIRNLLCAVLGREKIPCTTASDGDEAIEQLENTEFAIILLDLMLPRVNGYAVLQHIDARLPPGRTRPLVFVMSAYADEFVRRVDPAVVTAIIRKPFDVHEVRNLILDTLRSLRGEPADATVRLSPEQSEAVREHTDAVPDKEAD